MTQPPGKGLSPTFYRRSPTLSSGLSMYAAGQTRPSTSINTTGVTLSAALANTTPTTLATTDQSIPTCPRCCAWTEHLNIIDNSQGALSFLYRRDATSFELWASLFAGDCALLFKSRDDLITGEAVTSRSRSSPILMGRGLHSETIP